MSASAVVPAPIPLASKKHLASVLLMLGALTAYNFYLFHRANVPGLHTVADDHTMIHACAVSIAIE